MATTLGPDMIVDAASTPCDLAAPAGEDLGDHRSPLMTPQPSPRANIPLPNPHFVFPARPSSSSAPSSFSRATGRRPRSAIETQERPFGDATENSGRPIRSPALPDFSFNPGASLSPASDSTFLSPPQSPASPRMIPTRPGGGGHRRGGSEFVGGNIRAGEAITVMSTSPTKSESGMASPTLMPVNPSRPSRGHRHQRSGAISSHDLSMILQPKSPNLSARGSSAPTSPADFEGREHYAFPETSDPAAKQPTESVPKAEAQEEPEKPADDKVPESPPAAQRPQNRARVGFSDTLEFIPRPLSLVSSDTSSTATARPGHSVSGSISSIISLNSTIAEKDEMMPPLESSPSHNFSDSRPSTAGAVLERTESLVPEAPVNGPPRRRGSLPLLTSLPLPSPINLQPSTPSPTKTPKRWSFFGLDPFVGTNSPTRARPVSSSSSESSHKDADGAASSEPGPNLSAKATDSECSVQKATHRKSNKKQKKVKTWAGSILTRKSKPRHGKNKKAHRRPPTPPPPPGDVDDNEEAIDDSSDGPAEPAMPTVLITESTTSAGGQESWKPPRPAVEDDTAYPMIDLDAALGPFNTPLPRNPEWEAAQRAGGLTKRKLHSAAGLSRFNGPGGHYTHHQRAQSSPEMVPFEHGRRGIHRFGSSSTMADVFEEDEEDEDGANKSNDSSADTTPQATPAIEKGENASSVVVSSASSQRSVEKVAEDNVSVISSRGVKRKGSDLENEVPPHSSASMRSEPSLSSLQQEIIAEEPIIYHKVRSNSSHSATPSPRFSPRGKDLAPVDVGPLNLPSASLAPVSPYSMTQSSAFPSPRSPMSYDANRISTAPSSVAEDNFQSLLMGEPGPEVRLSVDIPSLTSSTSTMTRDSILIQQAAQLTQPPLPGERPASFTSSAFGVRRSSLASLSRLISSSHGERSKLSMEVTYSSDTEKKQPKVSKTKRLSKMVQFWKPKQNASA